MRTVYFAVFLLLLSIPVSGQVKDSTYHKRVDDRVNAATAYFQLNVTDDPAILDTVAYVKRIYASHIEKIRAQTNSETHREKMYAYAVQLHNNRLSDVLPSELLIKYRDSFSQNMSGFTFCPVCRFKYRSGQAFCGHCGEALPAQE